VDSKGNGPGTGPHETGSESASEPSPAACCGELQSDKDLYFLRNLTLWEARSHVKKIFSEDAVLKNCRKYPLTSDTAFLILTSHKRTLYRYHSSSAAHKRSVENLRLSVMALRNAPSDVSKLEKANRAEARLIQTGRSNLSPAGRRLVEGLTREDQEP